MPKPEIQVPSGDKFLDMLSIITYTGIPPELNKKSSFNLQYKLRSCIFIMFECIQELALPAIGRKGKMR